jgi:hypothetical protein
MYLRKCVCVCARARACARACARERVWRERAREQASEFSLSGERARREREHHILAKLVFELNFLSPPRAVSKSSTQSPFSLTV